jgi:hypothetical protein
MKNPTWAELALSLLYAATVVLFCKWLSVVHPHSISESWLHSAWSWIVAASGSSVATVIVRFGLKTSISWAALAITFLLILFFFFFTRGIRPLPDERWATTENGVQIPGQNNPIFRNNWKVTYVEDKDFACAPQGDSPEYRCRAFALGGRRVVYRYFVPNADPNPCIFFFDLAPDKTGTVSSQYYCHNGGPYTFTAKITKDGE